MKQQPHLKILWKDAWREITTTKARFSALIGIIILGTGFFVGIRSAAPDMEQTASDYYQSLQLADMTVSANYGLDHNTEEALDQLDGVMVTGYATVDGEEMTQHRLFKLYPNFNKEKQPNQFHVVTGHLPTHAGEIALDAETSRDVMGDKGYQIGDTLQFDQNKEATDINTAQPTLTNQTYKVVGFVASPLHLDRTRHRGYTALGKGILDAFAVVDPTDIKSEEPTAFAIQLPHLKGLSRYSEAYQTPIDQEKAKIEDALKQPEEDAYQKLQQKLENQIQSSNQSLAQAKEQLKQGEQTLTDQQKQWEEQWQQYQQALEQAWAQYPSGRAPKAVTEPLNQTKAQLEEAKQQLDAQTESFNKQKAVAEKEIKQGESALTDAKKMKDQLLKPSYQVNVLKETGGVKEYGENADRIAAIAEVFPWVFFLVATLVSFTTMTRMVDEERTRMGTLKALGYKESEIAIKFVLYALSACLIGSAIGITVGTYLFPAIIYKGYQLMYALPDIQYHFYATDILLTVGIALLTTVGPTLWTLRHSLQANAATLMRPKPPKRGQHILLERWSWLWRHLSFLMKITLRNLFRYKGRNSMTVIGILGCTALMVTGFGISDSISGLPEEQFTKIETNDAIVTLMSNPTQTELQQALTTVREQSAVSEAMPLAVESYHVETPQSGEQTVNLRVMGAGESYQDYYHLLDVNTNQSLSLPNDGVLVTNKLSQLLDLKVGDTIDLKTDQGETLSLPVRGIVKSYLLHDVFVSDAVYQQYQGEVAVPNTIFLHLKNINQNQQEKLAEMLMNKDEIANVTYTDTLRTSFDDTLGLLASITVVLIVAAAALAFIVLYSLQNINISERLQELSTIKVLGAYPEEVTLYIYRETLILSVIGILLGLGAGYGLTTFILKTVEVDAMIFPTHISIWSYLWSGGLSLLFSAMVMGIMHRRLRQVDMVEALKGVE
ncbi:MAG: FtsX-like permease family protein [Aerococcus sp.]|nr:FtsX-like permease family protein [Aerococcus sp.]